jgi:hypothetical protein
MVSPFQTTISFPLVESAGDSWGAEAAANQVDDLEIDWMLQP